MTHKTDAKTTHQPLKLERKTRPTSTRSRTVVNIPTDTYMALKSLSNATGSTIQALTDQLLIYAMEHTEIVDEETP